MPNYWVLKTEPTAYSYEDLVKDGGTYWDGVKNPVALKNMRSMKKGDHALIYHTGKEKAAIGIARITSDPYPDPDLDDEKMVVFDLEPLRRLKQPVPLSAIKADRTFADMALVRQGRLSVVKATKRQWEKLLKMGSG
jgi:predicted RNA-binding protein with PUA-like domain